MTRHRPGGGIAETYYSDDAVTIYRRAIGIEISGRYCEIAAQRLAQDVLNVLIPAEDVAP